MIKQCICCGGSYQSNHPDSIYCSKSCKYRRQTRSSKVEHIYQCKICDKICVIRIDKYEIKNHRGICKRCSCFLGKESHRWRGGFRYWSCGRFGRDTQGLSWHTQRKLAWDRAKHTCEYCGLVNLKRNPDVHHITPFRISHSHALENLVCLCKRCHMIEEAKCQIHWDGITLRQKCCKERCSSCDIPRRKVYLEGLCKICYFELVRFPKALEWRASGKSYGEIGKFFGLSRVAVFYWFKKHSNIINGV